MTSKLAPFHPILKPILSEVFPHSLKYRLFRPANLQRKLLLTRGRAHSSVIFGTRALATHSGRDKMGSNFGQVVRAGPSKSLIEDEADLSDWVSGLNSTSFKKTRVYSDSDNEVDVRESRGFRIRGGAGKRRRESDFNEDSDFTSRRGGEGRGRGRGRNEDFSGRRKNVNDSGGSLFGGRGRDRDSSEFRRGGKSGGERNNGIMSRGNEGRGEKRQSEGGREVGSRNSRGRGGNRGGLATNRGGKGMEKRGLVVTDDDEDMDEEEEDQRYKSFKELIDSDETDDESEEEEDEEEEVRADSGKERISSQFSQSSPQKSDSYLSESR